MGLNERQKQILELTEKKQRATVAYLSKKLYVSEMTVRRDLAKMEREGYLKRFHGGAMANSDYIDYSIDSRMHLFEKEKKDIAKKAEAHIHDGQTIFLPASSTCAFLIPCLKNYKDLLVITNSLQFLVLLSKMRIRCILTGGEYLESSKQLIGRSAEATLRSFNTDIAFLSCSGISEEGYVTVADENAATLVRIGFENATKRIILADRSKLNCKYTYNICKLDEADEIIIV